MIALSLLVAAALQQQPAPRADTLDARIMVRPVNPEIAVGDYNRVVARALSYARGISTNVTAIHAPVEEFLAALPPPGKCELVVVDPPRAGLGEKTARAVAGLGAPRLTYVSCDPATLSRDLRLLLESGYRVDQVHLVDLFPQTFHIESVFHLARQS